MKRLIALMAALVATNAIANVEIATCSMSVILSQHSNMPSDFFSDHGVSIMNNSSIPMSYKITYYHEVMNMFNDKTTLNIMVNPGQTYVDIRRFTNKRVWESNGQYYTRAVTTIVLEGKKVASCANNNYAYIT
jgi:glycyl-tRNA synthetase beta subunit